MTKSLCAALLCVCAAPALAADVAVSITVGQPGFYGAIDIGNVPAPRLLYSQPMLVQPTPEFVSAAPIYLHVPPGHEKHWRKHCAEYKACGRPVYFVSDDWYRNDYVPHYRQSGGNHENQGNHGHGKVDGDAEDRGHQGH